MPSQTLVRQQVPARKVYMKDTGASKLYDNKNLITSLRGIGRVWIQSMPISKLVQRLAPYGAQSHKEGGSVLGQLGNLFED